MHYAHERIANGKPLNMVHRDISPQNLVISFEGVVKVVDFGIARAELRETKTKAGTIKGKFAYMSPEQCVATNVDRRTDVFALGVIVHELLTGRRLVQAQLALRDVSSGDRVQRAAAVGASTHELDPALDAIVMKAVAKDKEERYVDRRGVRRRAARLPASARQRARAPARSGDSSTSTSSTRSKSTANGCAS